jgi:hypothetical protein
MIHSRRLRGGRWICPLRQSAIDAAPRPRNRGVVGSARILTGEVKSVRMPLSSFPAGSVASQKYRTQTPAFHRAHLRTSRRTWRLVVRATQTPLIRTLPAPHASRTCVTMASG